MAESSSWDASRIKTVRFSSMTEAIADLRTKIAMFGGRRSLHDLNLLIEGIGLGSYSNERFLHDFDWNEFRQFVARQYEQDDWPSGMTQIVHRTSTDEEAFDEFYRLFALFMADPAQQDAGQDSDTTGKPQA